MPIFHDTSLECALAIVRDGFRVSPGMILQDQCANFHEGHLSSQTPNEGCRMEFAWAGGPVEEFSDRSVADMQPGILYRQNWSSGGFWRLALRPGTDTGLTFVRAVYAADDPVMQGVHDVAEHKFAQAAGRTIPVRYRDEQPVEKRGLFRTVLARLTG
ncbi:MULTISPECIES: hypothetical protein [Methylorubrum]|uniref:Uncharacterized protein n=1 Tax=Methylorubrum rhodesianum TaxID=29427 RepID=A0ABU9ZAL4_9HYPH|nr:MULTISPECIES: hypothetical protein [Methylorubrum]MBK3405069.1 hypothetical protein [Methylorubrum rhodesianum]MBY0144148.1 hypothetical protein [Methylorubrum populi]MCP1542167.1 hypothetical protein [Methylorubrum extorquens]MCP1590488.1 hypothetical protein [Methylorubrum extorquens]